MFRSCGDTSRTQAANRRPHVGGHGSWIVTKGSRTHYRIAWIIVDVCDRREIETDPERRKFLSDYPVYRLRQIGVCRRSERHGRRRRRTDVCQARYRPALLIERNQRGEAVFTWYRTNRVRERAQL